MIFDGILNRTPASAAQLNPEVPAELEQIVGKCLEKDRDLRYQHASEIRADLQRLKRDRESGRLPSSPQADTRAGLALRAAARHFGCRQPSSSSRPQSRRGSIFGVRQR